MLMVMKREFIALPLAEELIRSPSAHQNHHSSKSPSGVNGINTLHQKPLSISIQLAWSILYIASSEAFHDITTLRP